MPSACSPFQLRSSTALHWASRAGTCAGCGSSRSKRTWPLAASLRRARATRLATDLPPSTARPSGTSRNTGELAQARHSQPSSAGLAASASAEVSSARSAPWCNSLRISTSQCSGQVSKALMTAWANAGSPARMGRATRSLNGWPSRRRLHTRIPCKRSRPAVSGSQAASPCSSCRRSTCRLRWAGRAAAAPWHQGRVLYSVVCGSCASKASTCCGVQSAPCRAPCQIAR